VRVVLENIRPAKERLGKTESRERRCKSGASHLFAASARRIIPVQNKKKSVRQGFEGVTEPNRDGVCQGRVDCNYLLYILKQEHMSDRITIRHRPHRTT